MKLRKTAMRLMMVMTACLFLLIGNSMFFMAHLGLFTFRSKYSNLTQPTCTLETNISHCIESHERITSFERPHVYNKRADFRIVVLTYNRPHYLVGLLDSISKVEMYGDEIAVEIWIDKNSKGIVDPATIEASVNFSLSNNFTTIHVHKHHAGLHKQWISTYSSDHLKMGEKEIVLFVEDDLLISKYSYRWIKAVHERFKDVSYYMGTSLRTLGAMHPVRVNIAANETIFMHRIFSTHAFSPDLNVWKNFQKWYAAHYNRENFKPYVSDIKPTHWYKKHERQNRTSNMWSMWMLYYTYIEQLYSVYFYPKAFQTVEKVVTTLKPGGNVTKPKVITPCLCMDRQAKGLHLGRNINSKCPLIDKWDERFVRFPRNVTKIDWSGLAGL